MEGLRQFSEYLKPVVQHQARGKSAVFWREDTGMHAAPYQICAHSLLLPDDRKSSNITGNEVDRFRKFLLGFLLN
jgi:hypothetical protein